MGLHSIEENWRAFAAKVAEVNRLTPQQLAPLRDVFFAGAVMLFQSIEEIGLQLVTEDVGADFLAATHCECAEFESRIKAQSATN